MFNARQAASLAAGNHLTVDGVLGLRFVATWLTSLPRGIGFGPCAPAGRPLRMRGMHYAPLALILVASAAQAQFKCTAPGGAVVYQQAPCADAGKQRSVDMTNTAAQQGSPAAGRPEYIRLAVARRQIVIGMTRAELDRSTQRGPDHASTSVRAKSVDQQLVYDRGGRSRLYVYLTDGVVTSFTSDE